MTPEALEEAIRRVRAVLSLPDEDHAESAVVATIQVVQPVIYAAALEDAARLCEEIYEQTDRFEIASAIRALKEGW